MGGKHSTPETRVETGGRRESAKHSELKERTELRVLIGLLLPIADPARGVIVELAGYLDQLLRSPRSLAPYPVPFTPPEALQHAADPVPCRRGLPLQPMDCSD
jgi:hypothetical protein